MKKEPEHMISKGLLERMEQAANEPQSWMAYNSLSFFLGRGDAFFFKSKGEADEFARRNISENLLYRVIPVESLEKAEKLILDPQFSHKHRMNTTIQSSINDPSSPKNNSVMNEKNLQYLVGQLQSTGFGKEKEAELREKMRLNLPEFSMVHHASFGKDLASAQLYFRKSAESDRYFFNNYQLTVRNEEGESKVKHTFYIHAKEASITFREAYNLLSGRAVQKELTNKEGEPYKAWLQMDFKEIDINGSYKMKQFHQNYGYDLEKVVSALKVKELTNPEEKEKLLQSLERGNRQQVTLEHNSKEHKLFIEASPQFKSLNVFDQNGQRINVRYLLEQSVVKQSVKTAAKKQDGEGEETQAAAQKKGRKQSLS